MSQFRLNVRHAVRLAIAGAASAATTVTLAQSAGSTTDTSKGVEEIVITGSRIKQSPNDVAIAPVTSVTSTDVQETGLVRSEDLLNNLPQVIAENSSGQSISSDGTASVSLRGLGSFRTMVLINGRRMQPGAGLSNSSSPDINQIPAAMIERVDLLTAGASSTYGADAVAGVVNFIMNTKFEGVKFQYNTGVNIHNNDDPLAKDALTRKHLTLPPSTFRGGANRDFSVTIGGNFAEGRGNATAYASYLTTDPVVGTDLDFSSCTLNSASAAPKPGQAWKPVSCGGSSSSATGRFLLLGAGTTSSGAPTDYATLADGTVDASSGLFRQYTSADSYNYGALSYLQRQAKRYTVGAFVNFDVNDHTNVYSETMFARNTSTAQYGASGLFAFGTPSISCSNPLFNASELAVLCSPANIAANQATFGGTGDRITIYAARRSVESGPRLDNYASNSFRQVVGLKGDWGKAWTYDVYGQFGLSQMNDTEGGFVGADQVNRALDVIPNPSANDPNDPTKGVVKGVPIGGAVCAAAVSGFDTACVPWDIWNKGGVTQAQLDYLTVQSSYAVAATEYIVSGSTTGDLGTYGWKLPSAKDGVAVNLGAEHRFERYKFDPDYVFAHGLASGGNGAFTPIDGAFDVNEIFGESRIPLIDGKPGIYHLGVELGGRYSDYSTGFKTTTYKLGLDWAPVQDLRVRASYNRAVRAPSVGDLYTPPVIGAGGTADLCWGTNPKLSQAECANTGVTATQYGHILANPAAQINTSGGGNVLLKPETADTYTVGFVVQPHVLPRFVASVDLYKIKINDTIASLTSNTVLVNCAKTGDPVLCGKIHRDPNTGSLWFNNNDFIDTNELNIGVIKTSGIDLNAHYGFEAGSLGKLALSLTGSQTLDWSTQPLPTSNFYDCTGYYGATCGAPTPKWKHMLQADWTTPWKSLVLTGRWRYIGSVKVDSSSSDPQLNGDFQQGFDHIGSHSYLDFSASMPVKKVLEFRLGINNALDKRAPIVLNGNLSNCPNSSCNDNTWVGTYDTMGRYVYGSISASF